jgi:hypothetical protein
MSSTKVCTFCAKKGIHPPHNHTVRNWKLSDKPIICPELLSTICTYCHIAGHTQQYCSSRKNSVSVLSIDNNQLKRSLSDTNMETYGSLKIQKLE